MFEWRLSIPFISVRSRGDLREILSVWRDRARQRRRLTSLDDRLLRDIGLDRLDAMREAGKPFWRA